MSHQCSSSSSVACASAPDIPADAGANRDDAEDAEGAAGEPDGDECRKVVEVCASLSAGPLVGEVIFWVLRQAPVHGQQNVQN